MTQRLKLVCECVRVPWGPCTMDHCLKRYYVDENGKKQGGFEERNFHNVRTKIGTYKDDKLDGLVTEIYGIDGPEDPHYATFSYVMGIRQGPFLEVRHHRVIKRGIYENDKLKEVKRYRYKAIGNESAVCFVSQIKGPRGQVRQRGD